MFVMKRKNIVQKVLACAVTLAVAVMFMFFELKKCGRGLSEPNAIYTQK